jgi:hydrogenase maturation protease HycI
MAASNEYRLNPFIEVFGNKTVLVGIGNSFRGDDGAGPALVERIRGKIDIPCLDAGPVPENAFGMIVKESPETVVLIDAAELHMKPGAFKLLTGDEILSTGFSTHTLSPAVFMGYLQEATGADVYMLGIQPACIDMDAGLSEEIESTLEVLADMIVEAHEPPKASPYPQFG